MAQLGRILVVLIAAASLAFAAFALSLATGGHNWEADTQGPLAERYEFGIQPGEIPNYTVSDPLTKQSLATSPIRAVVVNKALQEINKELTEKKATLDKESEQFSKDIPIIKELRAKDEAALVAQQDVLLKQLEAVKQKILAATDEAAKKAAEVQEVRMTAQQRREEVFRLKNQLEVLRTDVFAATQQKKALEDELLRLEENFGRLERRQEALKAQVGGSYDEPLPKGDAAQPVPKSDEN